MQSSNPTRRPDWLAVGLGVGLLALGTVLAVAAFGGAARRDGMAILAATASAPEWASLASWILAAGGLGLSGAWVASRLAAGFGRRSADAPLAALRLRYARGEVGHEEYDRIRGVLLRDEPGRPSRRALLAAAVAALGAAALVRLTPRAAWLRGLSAAAGDAAAGQVTPPWRANATGTTREFALTVGRTRWDLGGGTVVDAYAYDGTVPGPELRVTEGDLVRVKVTNELDEPTTVHWHGVEVPVDMDGAPDLSQAPIPPGGTFTYEFVATPAGTRWYHSHFHEAAQQGGGLVGPLIVEPRDAPSPATDREYTLVTAEWATGTAPAAQPPAPSPSGGMGGMMGGGGMMPGGGTTSGGGMMGAGSPAFDAFAVNGKTYPNAPPLLVRRGERVKLRLVNAGATQTQVVALAGHRLTLTHSDGNPLVRPLAVDAVRLGVGERADVEFVADRPGRWRLAGLAPGQLERGLAVDVAYEGHEDDPVQGHARGTRFEVPTYGDYAGPAHPASPDRTRELTLSGGMMGSDAWTINGRSYPDTAPIEVRPGERVRLRLVNMSMEDHPMHLHGHTFQVVATGGRAVDGPLKDTLTVRPMEQHEIEFVANNPGTWLFHCHNLAHMDGGLMTEVRYR